MEREGVRDGEEERERGKERERRFIRVIKKHDVGCIFVFLPY